MSVFINRLSFRIKKELTGHFEMKDKSQIFFAMNENHFPSPSEISNFPPSEFLEDSAVFVSQNRRKKKFEGAYLKAKNPWPQAPDNGLNFREFWHKFIVL